MMAAMLMQLLNSSLRHGLLRCTAFGPVHVDTACSDNFLPAPVDPLLLNLHTHGP